MEDSTLQLIKMWDDVSKCDICFKQGEKLGYCVGAGSPNPIVMTIGYHPLFDGTDQRENTIGKMNIEAYNKMLHAVGITKEQVWATNCVKCVGRRGPGIPNTCKKNLVNEIDLINPKLIITLGEKPFHILMDDVKLQDWIPNKEYNYKGRKLITMVSPQTISQNPRYERYWTSAALIIKQHLKQPSLDWWG